MEPIERATTNVKPTSTVEFASGRTLAVLGLLAGLAIALAVPWITLRFGDRLSSNQQVTVVILAVSLGGVVAFTAAFFGTVIPSSVSDGWAKPPAGEPMEADDRSATSAPTRD